MSDSNNTNNDEIVKVFISEKEIKDRCVMLAKKIKTQEIDVDLLIGLNRGGLIPLGYLSYFLDNRETSIIDIETYEKQESKADEVFEKQVKHVINQLREILKVIPENERVHSKIVNRSLISKRLHINLLIIDDLRDTGGTIKIIDEAIKHINDNHALLTFKPYYAVLYDKFYNTTIDNDKIIPTISAAEKPEGWLVFPWDEEI